MRKLIAALATIAVLPSFAAEVGYSTLISHRGESHDAPENTLPAFKMAVERGFGFECDVYLSKDKKVFTFHDRNLKRTTGGANCKACSDVTWEEISKLDVGGWGKWKGSKYVGTRPALLEEVLDLARDGRQIYVEIKTGPEIVPYIKEVFAKQNRATPKNTLFISFNAESCKEVKKLMPEYKVYYMPIFMCLGLSVGTAIGAATGKMPIFMPIGMSIGMFIGAMLDAKNKSEAEDTPTDETDTEEEKVEEDESDN
jgi:glycerophosphoryl diester phosphodiesterase